MKTPIAWVPKVKIGPFLFRAPITQYLEKLSLKPSELVMAPIELEYGVYKAIYDYDEQNIQIYVDERDRIATVSCYEQCFYKKINLIGLNKSSLRNVLDHEPDEIGDVLTIGDERQIPLEYFSYSAQVWISESTSVVRSIFCGSE